MADYADRDVNRSLRERLAEVQGSYERIRDGLAQLQEQMASLTVTATSSGDLVRATVDARGQLTALALAPRATEELRVDELAAMIVATARRAAADAAQEAATLVEQYSPAGTTAGAFIRSGNFDDLLRRSDEAAGWRPDRTGPT
jgi:DNA-binding protein YbaB